jgi:hypothetical protein
VTIKVVDGNLRVKLVPNSTTNPPAYYSVVYNSDGRTQFSEAWAVPASTQALRVRDVRIAAPSTPGGGNGNGSVTQESDVVGLIADLGARPVKGAAFAAGRVALINGLGTIDGVGGNASDCLHVDGSSAPCSVQPPSFTDGDAPAGIVDGANATFTLMGTPSPVSSLSVYRNGLLQNLGVDYTANGRSLQFTSAAIPQPGDTLLASYRFGGAAGAPPSFSNPQVLCGGRGATISGSSFGSLGTCAVPAGLLTTGDRVEIRGDFEHQGVTSGFSWEVRWGGTTVLHRDAAAGDLLAMGRVDAGLIPGGARLGTLSWGTILPLIATVASAPDSYTSGLTIDFQGKMAQAGETLTLQNFTVTRLR